VVKEGEALLKGKLEHLEAGRVSELGTRRRQARGGRCVVPRGVLEPVLTLKDETFHFSHATNFTNN
jgi:hypothetical protein